MKKIHLLLIISLLLATSAVEAQEKQAQSPAASSETATLPDARALSLMLVPGVQKIRGRDALSDEALRVITDMAYRKEVYTMPKTFENARKLFYDQQYLRSLYMYSALSEVSRDEVVSELLSTGLKTEIIKAALINTTWTYAMFDPAVISLPEGKIHIDNAGMLEMLSARTEQLVRALTARTTPKP
jgi:hypothetical protein